MRAIWSGAILVGAVVISAQGEPNPKILMFTKSSGFQHSVVARKGEKQEPGMAERIVVDLGRRNGIDVETTKDGAKINAANLANYQGLFFFTQGELTVPGVDRQPAMKVDDRPAILDFVKAGGGFVGTHCGGADTFHLWTEGNQKPFLEMVGGEFIGHGAQQVSHLEVVDSTFPAMKPWPKNFPLTDEWYAYQGFQPSIRVLMMIQTKGMKGSLYQRESYPITWCRDYGKGRVFYTGLGHREDVWANPKYQEMVGLAMKWSIGKEQGSAQSNLSQLFGSEESALSRINPPKK